MQKNLAFWRRELEKRVIAAEETRKQHERETEEQAAATMQTLRQLSIHSDGAPNRELEMMEQKVVSMMRLLEKVAREDMRVMVELANTVLEVNEKLQPLVAIAQEVDQLCALIDEAMVEVVAEAVVKGKETE